MNDLKDLKTAWGEPDPPSSSAHFAARAALMQQITAASASAPAPAPEHRRRPGLRLGWLAGGTAVAATVAAAVVFALTASPTRPGHPSTDAYSEMTGQQVLLAAATAAETKPATTGKYWHVKERFTLDGSTQTTASWTTRDGKIYSRYPASGGVVLMSPAGGFNVAFSILTLKELEQLPTEPDALKAWMTDSFAGDAEAPSPPPGAPEPPVGHADIPAEAMPGTVATGLTKLLYEVPAPPAVRAAAFRALARMPNVTNLGRLDGGHALRISFPPPKADKFADGMVPQGADEMKLVIDPETSVLLSSTNYQGTVRIVTATWRNTMPKVVEPPRR